MKQLIKKPLYTLVILFFSLGSCSDLPTEIDAEADLRREIFKNSKRSFSLIEFKKTDALQNNLYEQETYQIFYDAELKVLFDRYTSIDHSGNRLFYDFKAYKTIPSNTFQTTLSQWTKVNKGDKIKFNGVITYVKTENGWKKTR